MHTPNTRTIIHVQWEGPLSTAEVRRLTDHRCDYGVYQICGIHPVYGAHQLLYIGKARDETFADRFVEHVKTYRPDWEGPVQVYVGRLAGSNTPYDETWDNQIDCVETLLIHAHKPAHNSQSIKDYRQELEGPISNLVVLNWGSRGFLLPEASGDRWSSKHDDVPDYHAFGTHPRRPSG